MELAKVTSKGQITIPIAIRNALGIREGDKILFMEEGDRVILTNASTNALLKAQEAFQGVAEELGIKNEQDIIKYLRDYSLYFIAGISLCIPAMPRFWKKHRNHPLVLFLLALIFWMSVYYQSNSAGNPFMYLKF